MSDSANNSQEISVAGLAPADKAKQLREALWALKMDALKNRGVKDPDDYLRKGFAQSSMFMVDVIPIIHRLYAHLPGTLRKTCLDVGPNIFAGTQLLHNMHAHGTYSRLKLSITAIDKSPVYQDLSAIIVPDVEVLIQDIFEVSGRVWDFAIASAVIEHVPNPVAFAKKLQSLARDFVIFTAPWRETPPMGTGHINVIDKETIFQTGARDLNIYTSYTWGKEREMCTFWLPGTAV